MTRSSESGIPTTDLSVLYVPHANIVANSWNPNQQDDFIYARELESIRQFGFVNPIICRSFANGTFEIIDGEHRWKAAGDLGIDPVAVIDLGFVEDDDAKQLTIVLNETRGVAQPGPLRALLADLASRKPVDDLVRVLPYDSKALASLLRVNPDVWDAVETAARTSKANRDTERWVLRSFRLPADAADVLDDAIRRAQEDDGCSDWQALERIAADFLAS